MLPPLTYDQKLWLLTAHPDRLDLSEDAPEWLIIECQDLGLIKRASQDGLWQLTDAGYAVWREMRGIT